MTTRHSVMSVLKLVTFWKKLIKRLYYLFSFQYKRHWTLLSNTLVDEDNSNTWNRSLEKTYEKTFNLELKYIPTLRAGGVGIYSPVWPKPVQMSSICRKLFVRVILPPSPGAGENLESRRSGVVTTLRGGGSLGSVPLVNVDREKLLLFVYTGGMRDARLTRRARLVYAGSRITTLIKRSGGVDAAAGSFGGAVIPQSIYDLRPLTPATPRRNESC